MMLLNKVICLGFYLLSTVVYIGNVKVTVEGDPMPREQIEYIVLRTDSFCADRHGSRVIEVIIKNNAKDKIMGVAYQCS